MENYDFKSTKYWSQSLLQKFLGCAADVRKEIESPEEDTIAKIEGTVFHSLIEGNNSNYTVFDATKRPSPKQTFGADVNRDWKNDIYLKAEKKNKVVIELEMFNNLQKMVVSLQSTEIYKRLKSIKFLGAEKFYKTEINGVGLKIKPDHLAESANKEIIFCVDWKKTRENLTTNPDKLTRIIKKYNYNFQGVHYCEILREIFKKEVIFCLVFVQNTPPYNIVPVLLQKGKSELYEQAYIDWMLCLEQAKNFNIEAPETLDQKIKRLNNDLFIKL